MSKEVKNLFLEASGIKLSNSQIDLFFARYSYLRNLLEETGLDTDTGDQILDTFSMELVGEEWPRGVDPRQEFLPKLLNAARLNGYEVEEEK